MKARRKSGGEIIEVEVYMLNSRRGKDGSWGSSYKDINSGLVYEASELLFNLDYYTVISGWVCRDKKDNALNLHAEKPYRAQSGYDVSDEPDWWESDCASVLPLDKSLFPDLTWDDDPEPVEIIFKRKKNG